MKKLQYNIYQRETGNASEKAQRDCHYILYGVGEDEFEDDHMLTIKVVYLLMNCFSQWKMKVLERY